MTSDPQQANQAVRNAMQALRAGEKHAARRWAERAAVQNPQLEDAWLILAVVASPRASVAYLEKALEINPQSRRALAGMDWARQRLQEAGNNGTRLQPPLRSDVALSGRVLARRSSPLIALVFVLAFLVGIGLLWPGGGSTARALIRSNGNHATPTAQSGQPGVDIAKPTYTPTPTSTPTPSPTPSPTEAPTPTPLPPLLTGEAIQPQALSTSNGKLIVVDISEQHLYAYESETLVFSFIASTGMGNSTRIGTFSVLDKIPNAYGANWNIWMPDWLGIYWSGYLENGIHALPILPGGVRLWAGYLGTPISYGCVVLGVEEARSLYNWADVGTLVVIQW